MKDWIFTVALLGIMIPMYLYFAYDSHVKAEISIEAAKAGLEECPNVYGHKKDTIWIKDCAAFIESYKAKED